jgi:hypothetical protein
MVIGYTRFFLRIDTSGIIYLVVVILPLCSMT